MSWSPLVELQGEFPSGGENIQKRGDPQPASEKTFAAVVIGDDGEAASFAIAGVRGYAVATDDRKARRFATAELLAVPLFYTLEMIRAWFSIERVSSEEVRQALRNIRDHGSYEPGPSHRHRGWWESHI